MSGRVQAAILGAALLALLTGGPARAQSPEPPAGCQPNDPERQCVTVSQYRDVIYTPPVVRETCVDRRVITTSVSLDGTTRQAEGTEQACSRR